MGTSNLKVSRLDFVSADSAASAGYTNFDAVIVVLLTKKDTLAATLVETSTSRTAIALGIPITSKGNRKGIVSHVSLTEMVRARLAASITYSPLLS